MPAKPFADFRAEVLALYAATRAPSTRVKMAQVLSLVDRLGVGSTDQLTPELVARFVAEGCAGKHPNTAFGLLSYLRRACSYAAAVGYLDRSPFDAWSDWVRTLETTRPRHHGPEAIARVLAHLESRSATAEGGRLWALAATLAFTGLRRNEALFLRREDVDLATRTARVSARRRLKRPTAARTVPIPDELSRILAAWLPRAGPVWVFPNRRGNNAWHGGSPGYRPTDRLAAAGRAAGVPGFTPSSLRHSFATIAATRWGVPPAVLQSIMGHTSFATTLRYYVHVEDARLVELARAFRFGAQAA